jgi:hypothetical protein
MANSTAILIHAQSLIADARHLPLLRGRVLGSHLYPHTPLGNVLTHDQSPA